MTAPMPKDNEVDEKVMPVAWIVTNGGDSCEPWLEYEQSEVDALPAVCIAEPLYSAATVAELRARIEGLECAMEWVKAREEYLRGQVQRVIGVTEEFEGMTGAGYRYMAANIRAALTGADPT